MKLFSRTTMLFALLISVALIVMACNPSETTEDTTQTTTTEATTTQADETDTTSEDETEETETTSDETEETTSEEEPADDVEPADIRIGALNGPTGIGLVNLMAAQDAGTTFNQYHFELAGAPDDIVASLTSGQIDVAALPTNLAAVLYQRTNQRVQMLAVNTLGVLYILENGDTVQTVEDLAGQTLEATGQGAVPEYALNYVLAENNLTDSVEVVFRSEHAELATRAIAGQTDLVMLPEPFVSSVLGQAPDFRIALNLTDEWQAVEQAQGRSSELAMGCLVVRTEFAQENGAALLKFLEEYELSASAANADPDATGTLVEEYGVMPSAQLAARAIPNANIVSIFGSDMKTVLEPFYEVLFAANPQSVGGELPDDDFYFIG